MACLDRFSVKGPYEYKEDLHYREVEEIEEYKVCCGCGYEIDPTEEFVESEIAGEEYIHDLDECLEIYYKKEQDLNGEFKSLNKAI